MEKHETESTEPNVPRRQHAKSRRSLIAAIVAGALLVGGGVLTANLAFGEDSVEPSNVHKSRTVQVEKGNMQGTSSVPGTLSYAEARSISAVRAGTITWLPAAGDEIKRGKELFAIDSEPTYLMYGQVVAWRDFQSGMKAGPDVKVLEKNLKALGHFSLEPDEKFTWKTAEAIRKWQKGNGQRQTGVVSLGTVAFADGPLRVSVVDTNLAEQAVIGAPVITATGLTKVVQLNLKLSEQEIAKAGAEVLIDLPNAQQVKGTVAEIGVPTEKKNDSGAAEVTIPVTVALNKQDSAAGYQQVSVTVKFPTKKRKDVLFVPVGALLALDAKSFGIEVIHPDGVIERIPVKTGMFASGYVEISGTGIDEGQKVVVPS